MTENNPTADTPKAPAIAPIAIYLSPDDGHFLIAQDGRSSGPLCWGEMLEQIITLTRLGLPPKYPMLTSVEIFQKEIARRERLEAIALEREAEERQRRENISLCIRRDDAEVMVAGLSDLVSWIEGWSANRPDGKELNGFGQLRTLRARLRMTLAEGAR